jgi:small subunit ribosomal protein S16
LLVIRLARTGRTKYPTYRVVAAESARAATGKFIEVMGHYNPHTKELVLNRESIEKRLSQGAQPSNTVVKLLQREKLELPAWVKLKTKTPKKVEEPAAEAEAATETTEVTEAEAEADTQEGDEVRVAEVTEEAVAAVEDNAPNVNDTETANTDEEAKA